MCLVSVCVLCCGCLARLCYSVVLCVRLVAFCLFVWLSCCVCVDVIVVVV